MEWFSNKRGKNIAIEIIDAVKANREYLSRVDGEIGDGDHGVNMSKGFSIAELKIDQNASLSECFRVISDVLMHEIGGSMGPIYGVFFETLSKKTQSEEKITPTIYYEMLDSGISAVIELCDAQVGEKTLVDALVPAVKRFKESFDNNSDFENCLKAMVEGAKEGRDSTIDMIAKKGRSARLGARSKGVIDAGAASCFIILESFAVSAIRNIEKK